MSISCPACQTKMGCLSSRANRHATIRRYSCKACGHRLTTAEQEIVTRVGGKQPPLADPRRFQLLKLLEQMLALV